MPACTVVAFGFPDLYLYRWGIGTFTFDVVPDANALEVTLQLPSGRRVVRNGALSFCKSYSWDCSECLGEKRNYQLVVV